ncbi:MAG TPA: Nramp family divalent metal transporter [Vicinamibacterales bacterium]|nr:Nramp family divalent metal transporter [Vicinamibacterales bacterium]
MPPHAPAGRTMAWTLPARYLPPAELRELPDPPARIWRLVGPGVVMAGVGLSSGEFILWPYIAAQAGLGFLWAAALGVVTQFFLNMEIERYTLATGETALAGFNRLWKHWGLLFVALVCFANLWPGWVLSAAALVTYVAGGDPRLLAAAGLVLIGVALTVAPVVYVALERLIFVKMAALLVIAAVGLTVVVDAETWRALGAGLASVGEVPAELGFALLLGAVAFAGAGGGQNLCQSNWIRDKGFGMGRYVPRLVSPLTGEAMAAAAPAGFVFELTPANLARWRAWWRFANLEQAFSFLLVTVLTIALTSMLAHATLRGETALPATVGFLEVEGRRLQAIAGAWFGWLFWAVGAFALFGSAMGIADYTSRLAADVLKTTYLREATVSESVLYARVVWGLVIAGCAILLAGVRQPLVLLVLSACVGGTMMAVYSVLLMWLNYRCLPPVLRAGRWRMAALVWSALFFGVLAIATIRQQVATLLGP